MRGALGLLLVVVIAGCLGGIGAESAADEGPPEAAWTDGDGIDATELARHHFERLRAAGSFTTNRTDAITVDGDARPDGYYPPSRVTEWIDLDAGRYRRVAVTVGHRRSARFVSPDVTAARRTPCTDGTCEAEFDYRVRPEGDTLAKPIDRYRRDGVVRDLAAQLGDWNFTVAGARERDGTTIYRFEAARTLDRPAPIFSEPPRGTATLLVTEGGIVRRLAVRYDGTATVAVDGQSRAANATQRFVREYAAVGETAVERPVWVERAKREETGRETATGSA